MKKYSILSLLLAVLMLIFAALPCFATEYLPDSNVTAYGKIFYNGVNEVVDSSSQFDTHISNLSLFCENDKYIIRFTFDSDNYTIPTTMVSAKMNNANGDHYILCPDDKTVGDFEILKISYTLHANIHDLLPANIESMSDQSVLTILVSHNQDVYYWQAIVYPSNISAYSNVAELPCVTADSSEISNQFEYYFAGSNSSFEVNINSDDVMDVSEIDPSYFEIDFSNQPSVEANLSKASTSVTRASSDNPYRSYGIPNSAFTTSPLHLSILPVIGFTCNALIHRRSQDEPATQKKTSFNLYSHQHCADFSRNCFIGNYLLIHTLFEI